MIDKIARLTIHTALSPAAKDIPAAIPGPFFQRAWHDMASRVELLQTGKAALDSQMSAVNEGAAFRNQDNDYGGENTFEKPPDSPLGYVVRQTQVVGPRDTGWTVGTGTPSKGAYATYAGHTWGASYNQTAQQALDDAVLAVSQRLLAIEQALTAHGLIGA